MSFTFQNARNCVMLSFVFVPVCLPICELLESRNPVSPSQDLVQSSINTCCTNGIGSSRHLQLSWNGGGGCLWGSTGAQTDQPRC